MNPRERENVISHLAMVADFDEPYPVMAYDRSVDVLEYLGLSQLIPNAKEYEIVRRKFRTSLWYNSDTGTLEKHLRPLSEELEEEKDPSRFSDLLLERFEREKGGAMLEISGPPGYNTVAVFSFPKDSNHVILEFPYGVSQEFLGDILRTIRLPYRSPITGATYTRFEVWNADTYRPLEAFMRNSVLLPSESGKRDIYLSRGREVAFKAVWIEAMTTNNRTCKDNIDFLIEYFGGPHEISLSGLLLREAEVGIGYVIDSNTAPDVNYITRDIVLETYRSPEQIRVLVRKDVSSILSEIRALPNYPRKITIFGKKILTRNYIWYAYHSMNHIGMRYDDIPSIIEYLYMYISKEEGVWTDPMCTGSLRADEDGRVLVTRHGEIRDARDPESDSVCRLFLKDLCKRVEEGGCRFTSIYVVHTSMGRAHITIILVLKSEGELSFTYYDPHGQDADTAEFMLDMIEAVVQIGNETENMGFPRFSVIDTIDISCPIGAQSTIETEDVEKDTSAHGFCLIFSLFWIYCCIKVSLRNPEMDPYLILSNTESVLLSEGEWDRDVYMPDVVKFAYHFTNTYIAEYSKNPKWYERFNSLMYGYVEHKGDVIATYTRNMEDDIDIMRSGMKVEVDIFDEEAPHPRLYRGDHGGEEKSLDLYMRKHDGVPCERDEDCASDFCVEVTPGNRVCVGRDEASELMEDSEDEPLDYSTGFLQQEFS